MKRAAPKTNGHDGAAHEQPAVMLSALQGGLAAEAGAAALEEDAQVLHSTGGEVELH